MTPDELNWLRRRVGTEPDDTTLADMLIELGSRQEVASQILETRLADVVRSPTSLNIPDEISISNAGRARELRSAILEIDQARIIPPARQVRR